MSGFIYLWFDRKYTRYYLGSHWGSENDGYICSSDSMREAYRRRPKDFKRKIISKINSAREALLLEEQRYLDMIKSEEFGRKYYNINSKVSFGFWWINEETRKQVGAKISASPNRAKNIGIANSSKSPSEETRLKMSLAKKGRTSTFKGKKHSEESKKKMGIKNIGNKYCLGRKISEETKEKMRAAKNVQT